jgi:hypothetical protein
MRIVIASVLIAALVFVTQPAWADQRDVSPAIEANAVRQMAAAIPLGTRVKVRTSGGRRLTATLMSVTDEAIVVKREARVPEPAVSIRFDEVIELQRDEARSGFSLGKALGIGLAAGAGAILTLFAIAVSIGD